MTDAVLPHTAPPRIAAPTGRLLAPVAADLAGAAARIGHDVWWQERLFEVAGGWVHSEALTEAKLLLGVQRAHFGWRARQWHDRLPQLREFPRDDFVVSPNPAAEQFIQQLAAATDTVSRLVGLHRVVLPRLIDEHRANLAAASAVTDGPVVRTLGLLLPDEAADVAQGEALLALLLVDDAGRLAATEAAARFECALGLRV